MRINIWIVVAILLALVVVTRYLHHRKDTQRICADDPDRLGVPSVRSVIIECDFSLRRMKTSKKAPLGRG